MNRFLAPLSVALLAVAAQAQCYESNFGTLLGTGDDSAFPSTTTANPMNITFPMGGTFANYTHITANTNGCAFLWNAATGVVGATATGYSTTPATQLTNLRGAAGGAPRIAPMWRDLNLLAANNGGLWLNNTIPGKCVVTWANAVQFGTTTPIFTLQAQLFATGDIQFYYNGTLASTGATITGVSAGGGIAAVASSNLNPGPNAAATQLIFEQFAANSIDLQNTSLTFTAAGAGYNQTAAPCVAAFHAAYGPSCYTYNSLSDSFHQFFADAAVASAALQGNAVTFTKNANGYTGAWVAGGSSLFVPHVTPTNAFATATDDGNVAITPSVALPIPGGTATQVNIMSNGIVTPGATATTATDFSPTSAEFATHTLPAFYAWHDYDEAETTPVASGRIKYEEIGGSLLVTWDNVENYASPVATNPGTIQFQLNLTTGDCTIVFVTVDTNITSTFGSSHLVGLGGPNTSAAASVTLATALPITTTPNAVLSPLTLSASPAPVYTIGNPSVPITWTISNAVDIAPPLGVGINLLIFSVAPFPGGLELGPLGVDIGAAGCYLNIASIDVTINPSGTAPTSTVTFAVPQPLSPGLSFYAQAVSLFAPNSLANGLNPFGAIFSNGLQSFFQTF